MSVQIRGVSGNEVAVSPSVVGSTNPQLNIVFRQPIPVNAGEFLHIILKTPIATASSFNIRGVVGVDGTWV